MTTALPFSNPTTSRLAAESVVLELGRMEGIILGRLRSVGVATAEQLEKATGMRQSTVSARLRGLVLKGMIEDSGETMLTTSKRAAILWRLAQPKSAVQLCLL